MFLGFFKTWPDKWPVSIRDSTWGKNHEGVALQSFMTNQGMSLKRPCQQICMEGKKMKTEEKMNENSPPAVWENATSASMRSLSPEPLSGTWHELLLSLHESLSLCQLCAVVENATTKLLQCEQASVLFVDHVAEELYSVDESGRKTSLKTSWVKAPTAFVDCLRGLKVLTVNGGDQRIKLRDGPNTDQNMQLPDRPNDHHLIVPVVDPTDMTPSLLLVARRDQSSPPFQEKEQRLLVLFARHVAVAYRNTSIYTETERRKKDAEILNELAKSVYMNTGSRSLVRSILRHAATLIGADRCSLFMVDKEHDELYSEVFDMSHGINSLIDVNGAKVLMPSHSEQMLSLSSPSTEGGLLIPPPSNEALSSPKNSLGPVRFSLKLGVAGYVAETGETVLIDNAYEDARFNPQIDKEMGYQTRTIMCTPVRNTKGEIIGVAQLINKRYGFFTQEDAEWFENFIWLCRMALNNSHVQEMQRRASGQRDVLMQSVETMSEPEDLNDLVLKIMHKARELVGAACAAVHVLQDGGRTQFSPTWYYCTAQQRGEAVTKPDGAYLGLEKGVTGHVAKTGETMSICRLDKDPLYLEEIDTVADLKSAPAVVTPIRHGGKQVGVLKLVGRTGGSMDRFRPDEVRVVKTFASLMGYSIHKNVLYKKAMKAKHRTRLALEIISYHTHFTKQELEELTATTIMPQKLNNSHRFEWNTKCLTEFEMCAYAVLMYEHLGFVETYDLNVDLLRQFVLTVKHNYRDVPYHNWAHAFTVTHTFYTICRNLDLTKYLYPHEIMAQLCACLVHDIDHRGKNNAFVKTRSSEMMSLYGDKSILEHHHNAHFVALVKQGSIRIFEELPPDLYAKVFDHIRMAILATDLANHFGNLAVFRKFAGPTDSPDGRVVYDKTNAQHRKVLTGMLMTCCDIGNCAKPWDYQAEATDRIYAEFFAQGDEERKTGLNPIPMMDRNSANIPDLQLGFLDHVCIPTYTALAAFLPETKPMVDQVQSNRARWQRIKQEQDNLHKTPGEPLYLPSL